MVPPFCLVPYFQSYNSYSRHLDGPYWMACMGQCLGGNEVQKGLKPRFIHPMTKTICNDAYCFCDGGCGPCGGCWTCCRPCNSCRCCDCNGGDCCNPIGCKFTDLFTNSTTIYWIAISYLPYKCYDYYWINLQSIKSNHPLLFDFCFKVDFSENHSC